ncbi:MAG: hypothetical protein HQK96_12910 [Nitrospirae bacterium]|nr:hypothetical protein [Nitrospirota bacterium]
MFKSLSPFELPEKNMAMFILGIIAVVAMFKLSSTEAVNLVIGVIGVIGGFIGHSTFSSKNPASLDETKAPKE